jgi:cGMP-dependent protein kinase 1
MEGSRLFNELRDDQKNQVTSVLITQMFYKNQDIITEGDPGSSFYVIKEGTAVVLQ